MILLLLPANLETVALIVLPSIAYLRLCASNLGTHESTDAQGASRDPESAAQG